MNTDLTRKQKIEFYISAIFGLFCLFLHVIFLLPGLTTEPSFVEISRLENESLGLDAVVIETNGGATTSFGYLVYIVKTGRQYSDDFLIAEFQSALKNEKNGGLSLDWVKPNKLLISYYRAKSITSHKSTMLKFQPAIEIEIKKCNEI